VKVRVKVITLGGSDRRRLVTGILFIVIGLLFLLDRMFFIETGEIWRFWPLILVAFGLSRVFGARPGRRHRWGLVQVVLGVWLLLDQIDVVRAGDSWPVLVMALGALIIVGSFRSQPRVASSE